jgi:pilus assembly protein Flp/PilA
VIILDRMLHRVNYNQEQELEMNKVLRFLKDKSGATAIEYGLIAALISITIVAGANIAGPALDELFTTIGTTVDAAGE